MPDDRPAALSTPRDLAGPAGYYRGMTTVSYKGIDEAILIHALYHGTQPLGMGAVHDRPDLTIDDVREIRGARERYGLNPWAFDYLFGRPLKLALDTKTKMFDSRWYDRDAGLGTAQRIVDGLRRPGSAPSV
jgi:hypothetical protein